MPTQDAVIFPALPRVVVASALRRHDALAKPTVRKVAARPYRWDAAPHRIQDYRYLKDISVTTTPQALTLLL
jgi:hypothetical protein